MKRFLALVLLFAVVPMAALNSLDRPAFLGYYLGVLVTWLVYAMTLPRVRS